MFDRSKFILNGGRSEPSDSPFFFGGLSLREKFFDAENLKKSKYILKSKYREHKGKSSGLF